jgi:hypothetical protein
MRRWKGAERHLRSASAHFNRGAAPPRNRPALAGAARAWCMTAVIARVLVLLFMSEYTATVTWTKGNARFTVAALSSCHMLWFLSIAAKAGHCVETYRDAAVGVMRPNAEGRVAMMEVTLRPHVVLAPGSAITPVDLEKLHDEAHHECFIANSVRTEVVMRGTFEIAKEAAGVTP